MKHQLSGIPRRIIQTAKSQELPLFARSAVVNVKLLNQDFEYCFFDNAQVAAFMAERFPQYQETFANFPHNIQRYDFFRYLAVYALGGFYFDTDVFFAKSLAPLLDCGCVFPFEELTLSAHLRKNHDIDWELGNYAFGARAGDPFLKVLIDSCVNAQKDTNWSEPMMKGIPGPFRGQFVVTNSTGPGMVTRALAENHELRKTVTVLFPRDVCDEDGWHQFGDYGVHLMAGSWRSSEGFIRSRLARRWEVAQRAKFLKESRQKGPTRPGEWISA